MKKIALPHQQHAIRFAFGKIILLTISFLWLFDSYAQTPIDLSRPVGMTEGAAGANGVGAGTYVIPIDLPSGAGGYKPPVGLSYSSQVMVMGLVVRAGL